MAPVTLVARLYEHIEPLDRGTRCEDPLDAALRERGLGEVTGGGSPLTESGEIEFADIEIQVGDVDDALPVIVSSLETSGAPTAADLMGDGGVLRRFGRQQSLAVYAAPLARAASRALTRTGDLWIAHFARSSTSGRQQ